MQEHVDPRGHQVAYTFDDKGFLTRVDRAETGSSHELAAPPPAAPGELVTRTTAQGRSSSYEITPELEGGELWTVIGPSGIPTQGTFAIDGVTITTRADGSTTTSRRTPDPRWGMTSPFVASELFATGGKTRTTSRTRTVTLANPDDPTSLLTQTDVMTVNGRSFTTLFDDTGPVPLIRRTTAAGRVTVTELDAQGRPTRIEVLGAMNLAPSELDYDDGSGDLLAAGFLRSLRRGVGLAERRYDFAYDAQGYLAQVAGPLGTTVDLTYDAAGRVASRTLSGGEPLRLGYDASGNLTTVAQPGSPPTYAPSEVHQQSYEARSLLEAYTAPDIGLPSHTTSYAYSADGDLELITRPDALTVDRVFDSAGRLSQLITPDGTIDYIYFATTDPVAPGKLQAIINNIDGITLSHSYAGRLLTSTTWTGAVSGTYSRTYDDDLRLASDTISGDTVIYTYGDADGLLTQAGALTLSLHPDTGLPIGATLGALSETVGYNEFAEPTSYTVTHGAAATPLYQLALVRDALGRVIYKTETVAGSVTGSVTGYAYRYDALGRVTEVDEGTTDCSVGGCSLAATYTYDENGNRTSVTDASGTDPSSPTAATFDAQDRILTHGATTFTHTAAGELATRTDPSGTTTYHYDVLGNLRRVELPTGTVIEYLVDGKNRRVGKLVDGVMTQGFLYADGAGAPVGPIAELGPDGTTVVARFVYTPRSHVPDYMVKLVGPDAGTYRFVTDQLGSVRVVVGAATGAVVQQIRYDAWGNATLDHGTWSIQPFGFAGGLHDPDTGLVRFGARDYNPPTGRWSAKDPIRFAGGDSNLYAYVLNNPINFIDPRGLFVDGGASAGVGAGLGIGIGIGVTVGIGVVIACTIWDCFDDGIRDLDRQDVKTPEFPSDEKAPDDDVCTDDDDEGDQDNDEDYCKRVKEHCIDIVPTSVSPHLGVNSGGACASAWRSPGARTEYFMGLVT
jgi:RHS repeat-associated protein